MLVLCQAVRCRGLRSIIDRKNIDDHRLMRGQSIHGITHSQRLSLSVGGDGQGLSTLTRNEEEMVQV